MKKNHAIKRLLLVVLILLTLVPFAIIGYQTVWEPGHNQPSVPVANRAEQISRGAYLARAGNCMGCHTSRGGKEYAGGRAIATPFGNIYASNLTPDTQTGIGDWSADDFWRAVHNGKSKDGKFLYPAFPYPNYTKSTRADSDAIYAYLRTVAPVVQANVEHDLQFPFNQRILLAFWRALYFTPGEYQMQSSQNAEWNRGAYLVQGLGHCSACHTSRTVLGGTLTGGDLGGGMIPMLNWYASSLTSDAESGLGNWHKKDVADLLKIGVSQRGAVFGPMAEVVATSLQHLTQADIDAMAEYLKSVPKSDATSKTASLRVTGDGEAILKQGAKLYEQHCVECHKADGKGVPPAYPPLADNRSLTIESAVNPIRMVLNGGYPPSTGSNPRPYGMPPFGSNLNDAEIAAVVSYIRTSWANKGELVSPIDVGRLRGAPIE